MEEALAGLVQAAASLGKTFLDTEQAQFVGTLRSSIARLSTDLGAIMTLNRLNSGGLELASEMLELEEVIEHTRVMHETQARDRGLRLESKVDPECPKLVVGDAAHLELAIGCIVDNAIKCTGHGVIKFGVEYTEGEDGDARLRFFVSDKGRGLSPEIVAEINDCDWEEGLNLPSRGLGLMVAGRLLDQMGATLQVESHEGTGCDFRFELPLEIPNPTAV
jgi:signal transduction histidine kinase